LANKRLSSAPERREFACAKVLLDRDVLQLSGEMAGHVNRETITRPAIFKWRQTESGLILCAVRLRYSLSLREVEELLEERGLRVDAHNGLALAAVLRA
jgi:hypothetical protein